VANRQPARRLTVTVTVTVRDASEADLAATLEIYNEVIATSTAVFTDVPRTLNEHRAWWEARRSAGFPVLVAAVGEEVVGFASYGQFRPWPGYRGTVEHSVHVRGDRRRQGIGRLLLAELMSRARAQGHHVMVAGIDGDNAGSIALHEALGFVEVGRMPEVARKFGRRLDLVLLQAMLAPDA
jgi:L-amino acid N-acyltransferase